MAFESPLANPYRRSRHRRGAAFRSRGGRRTEFWSPAQLGLRAWYDAELGQPKYGGPGAYVQLDGTSGDYIYTPDTATVSFSNDIEVVMRVKVTDWSAAAIQTLVGKYVTTGNQRSWKIASNTSAQIIITVSTDGTTTNTATITPTVALPDNTWIWLRLRMDLTNGSNSVGTVETAADAGTNDEPSSWTANGTATATALAGIFDSTAPLEIGSFQNGASERLVGQVGRCIVRSGFAGTTVADFNASNCYGPGYLNQGSLPTDGGGARYVPLRGVSGDYVWTADKAALRVTGDIELVARVALNDWTPSVEATVLAREQAAANRSFRLSVLTDGRLNLTMTSDGSTLSNAAATSAGPWVDNTTYWVKVTRRQSDGRVQCFYASDQTTEPTGWTQLGADLTLSSGAAIYSGTSQLEVGARLAGATQPLAGRVYRAIVRSGIGGTVVADFNAEQATVFGQAADGYGNGWLIADPKHLGNWTLGLPKIYDRSGNGVAPATFGAGSNQPTWLPWRGDAQVYIPGQAGNFVSCPTSAALDVTGDVDLRATAWLASLTAAQNQTLVGTMRNGDLTGFMLHVSATGSLQTFHGNGAAVLTTTCPVTLASAGVVPGKVYEFRAAIDVNDGAGNYVVSFYLRQPGDSAWVLLGTTTTAGATSIGASGRACYIGQQDNFSARILTGAVVAASVRNGIDGTVVADFVAASCGQSGYTDTLGNAWAPTRATGGRKVVVQSPVAASARSVILHGTDDWIDVPAAAIPSFAASSSFFAAIRAWNTHTNFMRVFSNRITGGTQLGIDVSWGGTGTNLIALFSANGTTGSATISKAWTAGVRSVIGAFFNATNIGIDMNASGRASTTRVSPIDTGTIGRIAASTGGSGPADVEFEALVLLDAEATDTEHGQLTAYYKGGL